MANNPSAEKRNRQSIKRRDQNRARVSKLRTEVKKIRLAVEAGDKETAEQMLPEVLGLFDRTAQRGSIHKNAAARRKGRLTRLVRGA